MNTQQPVGQDGSWQSSPGANAQQPVGQDGSWQNTADGYQQVSTWQGAYNQNSSQSGPQQNDSANGRSQQDYHQGGYQQQPYQQYGYGAQYTQYQKADSQPSGSGFGIASMILGILSLVLFCTCINIPMAIAAIIFGVLQFSRNREGKGMAAAGIITAVLSVMLLIISVILLWGPVMSTLSEWSDSPYPGYGDEFEYEFEEDYDDYDDFFDSYNFFDYFSGRDHF